MAKRPFSDRGLAINWSMGKPGEEEDAPPNRRPLCRRGCKLLLFTCTAMGAIHASSCLSFGMQTATRSSRPLPSAWEMGGLAFQPCVRVAGGHTSIRHHSCGFGYTRAAGRDLFFGVHSIRTREVAGGGPRMQEMPLSATSTSARGKWLERDPRVLDGRLRTDDGFLTTELQYSDTRDYIADLKGTFRSAITKRILFRLSITTAWAAYVTATVLWGDQIAPETVGPFTDFSVPNWPHELVGGFLAILIVFRTNQAYERFWEGRKLWADLIGHTRKLTSLAITHMPSSQSTEVLAHVAAFPTALKMHLRGYKNEKELVMIYASFLGKPGKEQALQIAKSNNMPITIVTRMSQLMVPLRGLDRSTLFDHVWQIGEECLDGLTICVSDCEKIKCTPLPLSYSRHTSRFFSLFCFSLPVVLVKQTSPLIVPIVVMLVSWVLYATNEVGHVIEDPFGSKSTNDLAPRVISRVQKSTLVAIDGEDIERPIKFSQMIKSEEEVTAAYHSLDVDRKGYVTLDDAARGLPALLASNNLPAGSLQTWLDGLDADEDGIVELETFMSTWTLLIGSVRIRQLEALPLNSYCDAVLRDTLYYWSISRQGVFAPMTLEASMLAFPVMEVFERMDRDGSGLVSKEELRSALPPWATDEDVKREFQRIDANGDGEVTLDEIRMAWGQTDASAWLRARGFGEYCELFDKKEISIDMLVRLTAQDLAALGVSSLGKRIAIMEGVEELKKVCGLDQ